MTRWSGGKLKIFFDDEIKKKRKMQEYIRVGTVSIEDVLPYIVHYQYRKGKYQRKRYCGQVVKMISDRLNTFALNGIECVKCGIKGRFFAIERDRAQDKFHLNLYALDDDNDEVLMTKDHIVPIAKDGKNRFDNYQTMCCICNGEKADKLKGK